MRFHIHAWCCPIRHALCILSVLLPFCNGRSPQVVKMPLERLNVQRFRTNARRVPLRFDTEHNRVYPSIRLTHQRDRTSVVLCPMPQLFWITSSDSTLCCLVTNETIEPYASVLRVLKHRPQRNPAPRFQLPACGPKVSFREIVILCFELLSNLGSNSRKPFVPPALFFLARTLVTSFQK